jgi:hypothetical protein
MFNNDTNLRFELYMYIQGLLVRATAACLKRFEIKINMQCMVNIWVHGIM